MLRFNVSDVFFVSESGVCVVTFQCGNSFRYNLT